jgi:hypothetical protein
MNYRRIKLTLHLSLLGCALLAMAWSAVQWQWIANEQAVINQLGATRTALEARVAGSNEQFAGAAIWNTQTSDAGIALAQTTAPMARRPVPTPIGNGEREARRLADDPVLQKLFLAAERASLSGRYAAFFRAAELDAEEIARLEELIFQRNERQLDLDHAARLLRLEEQNPALRRTRGETEAAFRAKFVDRFGPQTFAAFNEYERTLPAWEFVNRFAGAVALEGEPLSPTQAASLVETLASASPPYREGGTVDTNRIDWPAVWTETLPVLSEPQYPAFINMAPIYRITPGGGANPMHNP